MTAAFFLAALALPALQHEPFVNRTPETQRLGKARAAFFDAIFKASGRHRDIDYVGYRSMLMVDHTLMLWPVGRADEVIFDYGRQNDSLLTGWRLVNGVPRREFQIAYTEGRRKFPYGGTLSEYLGKLKTSVPNRYAKPLKRLLETRQAYASYIQSAAEGVCYCRVIRKDGSTWPVEKWDPERIPFQSDANVREDGFAITDEELRLMAARTGS